MSFGGSGGSGQQTSTPSDINFLNPVTAVIANMFGIPVSMSPEGGLRYGAGSGANSNKPKGAGVDFLADMFGGGSGSDSMWGSEGGAGQFADQIFGPGSFEALGDFLTEENIFGDSSRNLAGISADQTSQGVDSMRGMSDMLMNLPGQMGEKIDIGAITEQAGVDLSEQFATSGMFSGSDFQNAALRTTSQLEVGEEQAAKERFMNATLGAGGLIGGLNTAAAQLPGQQASNLLAYGEQYGGSTATARGRSGSLLQMLQGVTPTGAVPRGNYSQGSSKNMGANAGWG